MYKKIQYCTSVFNISQCERFSTTCSLSKEVLKSLKGRKPSSQEWLRRQFADPYVEKARKENYRCRSAFKLIEIDDKAKILKTGHVVLDCGASPGSWTQVAISRVRPNAESKGMVVGIDLRPIHPIEGAVLLGGHDFTKDGTKKKILQILDNRQINVVLSDMAPNSTGIKSLDQDLIMNLAQSVVRFALEMSAIDASLLIKVWDGQGVTELEKIISKFYTQTKRVKPQSSRGDSAEMFLLSTGFKGIKR
ncbi:rRNA methyltransferase 2, mitochondrial [Nilaparvata lugens]|uniref:rRNA methyltransferase 2, mitochondrial n=1 Tax=Nilaparvata lugens TaxID=108931 RepID=UPI00193E150C|nr:rRNA methyltransferase 2, mitochondrial [Nilaparvata lugens]